MTIAEGAFDLSVELLIWVEIPGIAGQVKDFQMRGNVGVDEPFFDGGVAVEGRVVENKELLDGALFTLTHEAAQKGQ